MNVTKIPPVVKSEYGFEIPQDSRRYFVEIGAAGLVPP
jgi:hypothetical protein